VKVNWREVFKFLSGAAFVGAGINFYLYLNGVQLPPFFGLTISHEFLGFRSLVGFILFLIFFYAGYLKNK
jgi:hypothetical protein